MSEPLTVPIPRDALLYPHRSLLPRAWVTLRTLRRYRDLFRYLVHASLRTENIGTAFGFLWWLLDPLLLMLVYVVLVSTIFHRSTQNFPIFLMCAMLPWEAFTEAISVGMGTTVAKHKAMSQIAFPRAILPLGSTGTAAVHLLVAMPFLVAGALAYGYVPSLYLLQVIPVIAIELMLALGFSYFFSGLNMIFRDIQHFMPPLLRMWFFLSPGLYPLTQIPEHWRHYFLLNPIAEIFFGYRDAILYHQMLPLHQYLYAGVFALVVLIGGYLSFVHMEPAFAKID
jgi:lipopolysaccharide transport system permease protein